MARSLRIDVPDGWYRVLNPSLPDGWYHQYRSQPDEAEYWLGRVLRCLVLRLSWPERVMA